MPRGTPRRQPTQTPAAEVPALPEAPEAGWVAWADRPLAGHIAPPGLEGVVAEEIAQPLAWRGRLFVAEPQARPVYFAQVSWPEARVLPIASVKDGVRQLRAIQRNWWLFRTGHDRRAKTIAGHLPAVKAPPLAFGEVAPTAPLGGWSLVAPDTILAGAATTSPFPSGEAQLAEDKAGPPNRAYLKLVEALALLGRWPAPGETALDLGASPGGWSWVLAQAGARVWAVDKAPLDAGVARLPGVVSRQDSAFALDPRSEGPVDWLVADIACYPRRLLGLVESWLAAGAARTIVATVKFQGATDHAAVDALAALPGAELRHLWHNKHELTLIIAGAA